MKQIYIFALFLGVASNGVALPFPAGPGAQQPPNTKKLLSDFRPYWYEMTTISRSEMSTDHELIAPVFEKNYVAPKPFKAVLLRAKETFEPQLWGSYRESFMVTSFYQNPPSRFSGSPKGIIFIGRKGTIYEGLSVQLNENWGPDPKAKYEAPGYLGPRDGWTTIILRARGKVEDVPLFRQSFQFMFGEWK